MAARRTGPGDHVRPSRMSCRRTGPTCCASSCCRFPLQGRRFVRGLEFRPGNRTSSTMRTSASIARRGRAISTLQDPLARLRRPDGEHRAVSRRALPRVDAGPGRAAPAEGNGVGARTWHRPGRGAPPAADRQSRSGRTLLRRSTSRTSRRSALPAMLRLGRQDIDIARRREGLHDHRFVHAASRRGTARRATARALPRATGRRASPRCRTARQGR